MFWDLGFIDLGFRAQGLKFRVLGLGSLASLLGIPTRFEVGEGFGGLLFPFGIFVGLRLVAIRLLWAGAVAVLYLVCHRALASLHVLRLRKKHRPLQTTPKILHNLFLPISNTLHPQY